MGAEHTPTKSVSNTSVGASSLLAGVLLSCNSLMVKPAGTTFGVCSKPQSSLEGFYMSSYDHVIFILIVILVSLYALLAALIIYWKNRADYPQPHAPQIQSQPVTANPLTAPEKISHSNEAAAQPLYCLDVRATPILTGNEREFFYRLARALPDHHIFPQVSFGAILQPAYTKIREKYFTSLCRFNQKRADFVICAPGSLKVMAVIELDDSSHDTEKDGKRDEILTQAGYRIIRFQSRLRPSETEIAEYFS